MTTIAQVYIISADVSGSFSMRHLRYCCITSEVYSSIFPTIVSSKISTSHVIVGQRHLSVT